MIFSDIWLAIIPYSALFLLSVNFFLLFTVMHLVYVFEFNVLFVLKTTKKKPLFSKFLHNDDEKNISKRAEIKEALKEYLSYLLCFTFFLCSIPLHHIIPRTKIRKMLINEPRKTYIHQKKERKNKNKSPCQLSLFLVWVVLFCVFWSSTHDCNANIKICHHCRFFSNFFFFTNKIEASKKNFDRNWMPNEDRCDQMNQFSRNNSIQTMIFLTSVNNINIWMLKTVLYVSYLHSIKAILGGNSPK